MLKGLNYFFARLKLFQLSRKASEGTDVAASHIKNDAVERESGSLSR
jgi:hypothetical protein